MAAIALMALASGVALAHIPETVGPYFTEVGWLHEPAVQGQLNALDILIETKANAQPVDGADQSLKAQVMFGNQTETLPIEPQADKHGAYTSSVLPTQAGGYKVHLIGTLNGTPFNTVYDLGGDSDSLVLARSQVAFPPATSGPAAAAPATNATPTSTPMPTPSGTSTPAWVAWSALALGAVSLVLALTGVVRSGARGQGHSSGPRS